jgi:hypothetical protein
MAVAELNVARNAVGAILFMEAANMTYQSFGTLNSSPWTIENVGADGEKVSSMHEYNWHAGISALVFASIAAYAAKSVWPIVGVLIVFAYLRWIYSRAVDRGESTNSVGAGWFDTWGKEPA